MREVDSDKAGLMFVTNISFCHAAEFQTFVRSWQTIRTQNLNLCSKMACYWNTVHFL